MKTNSLKKIWLLIAAPLYLAAALAGNDTSPDFSINVTPPQRSINAGESTEYNVVVHSINEFQDLVTLSMEGLPDGAQASFDDNPVTPTKETKLRITTLSDTPTGTYTLTIKGEGGGKVHTTTVILEIKGAPDFTINASPPLRSIYKGEATFYTVVVHSIEGFNESVNLSVEGLPSGASASFDPNPVIPTAESKLNIQTTSDTPSGNYELTIKGSGGEKTHSTTVTLEIKPFISGFLEKTFSLSQAYPGQQIEMTLLLKNNSGNDFHDITLRDELPAYLLYLDDDASPKANLSGSKISWFFRRLKQGSKIKIKVKLKIAENCPPLEIRNLADFQHSLLPKPLASNPAVIKIQEFRIQLNKTVSRSQARPADLLEYRIIVRNPAAHPLPAARLQDTLDAELELVSQQSGLAFQQQGATLIWTGDIAAGKETGISFTARIRADVVAGTRISNGASLESRALSEPLLSNTVSTLVVSEPIASAQVRFSKKADIPQSEVGRIIRFRLLMENRSPSILLAPRLEDYLPQGFDYVPGSSACDGVKLADPPGRGRLDWPIPAIRPGQTSVLTYQVVIGADVRRGRNVNRAVFHAQDQSGQNLRLEAEAFVNISSNTIVFYSAVEGNVFLDRDGNEFYSPADTPLPGIEVRLSNGQQSLTDARGRYSFQSLFPGDYALGLNRATLPERYRVVFPVTKAVTLFDGLTDTVDFAVSFQGDDETPTCRLQGRVFFDKVPNQAFDAGEPLLADFKVGFDDALQTTGKDGSFVFSKLPPGKHTLTITYGGQTVRREVSLPPGQTMLDIPLPFSGIVITVQGEK